MKALWLENGRIAVRDGLPRPLAGAGEALIRVRLAGICGTDLQLLRGYYPFSGVPGHEFVGEVMQAPDQAHWEGRRVVGEINAACGECVDCRAGRHTHCRRRTVLGIRGRHGAFAEYLTLPVANLHTVPTAVPDEAAVFTEPLAAALQITAQVTVLPEHRVHVIGAGRLGQLAARVLAAASDHVTVAARHARQRELLQAAGITAVGEQDIPAGSADIVVDTAGSGEGLAAALRAVRPRGTIVLKSTYKGPAPVDMASVVVNEITVVGSRCGPFAAALRLLDEGRIDPVGLIDERYALGDGVRAFDCAARRGAMKILLQA